MDRKILDSMDIIVKIFGRCCWTDDLKRVLISFILETFFLRFPRSLESSIVNPEGKKLIKERVCLIRWGKCITLIKDRLSSTHLQLQTKLNFQKTSGRNCWNSNNLLITKRLQLKQKTASKLKPYPVEYAENFRGGAKFRHNRVTSQINFRVSAEGTTILEGF